MTTATAPAPTCTSASSLNGITAARAARKGRQSRQQLLAALAEAIRDRPESQRTEINKIAGNIPTPYLRAYTRAITGQSLKAIVKSHCMDCVCWQRKEVRLCPNPACELWRFRPYQ